MVAVLASDASPAASGFWPEWPAPVQEGPDATSLPHLPPPLPPAPLRFLPTSERKVDTSHIQRSGHPTRDVLVTRSLDGDRTFAGFSKPTDQYADCFLEAGKLPLDVIKVCAVGGGRAVPRGPCPRPLLLPCLSGCNVAHL